MVASLATMTRIAKAIDRRVGRYRLEWVVWTPAQLKWLKDPSRRKLFRTGNQAGKTWVGLAEVHYRCTGTHPFYRTHTPPVECWIICASWKQSISIQKKFWELIDRDAVIASTEFSERNGFRGKDKAVEYKNGSIVRFKTTQQASETEALEMASGTVHYVHIDEPTYRRVYAELSQRVARTGGSIGLTLTPINGPVGWLRALVNKGIIEDHHHRCTPELFWPIGAREPLRDEVGTLLDQAWIDERALEIDESEIDVILHGGWETKAQLRSIAAFKEKLHVVPAAAERIGEALSLRSGWPWAEPVHVCLATDHGVLAAHQCWLVLAYQTRHTGPAWDRVHIRVVGEYFNPAGSSEEDDVEGVEQLLRAVGLSLDHVVLGVGDTNRAGRSRGAAMLNTEYQDLFAAQMGLPKSNPSFVIDNAHKGSDSLGYGVKVLNNTLRRSHLEIGADCPTLIEAVKRWSGKDDSFKHAVDALRYGVTHIFRVTQYSSGGISSG